ncbi:glycine dehydrogenase (aminomethyl-transferring), partial [Candidatus Saganbacteria bacterium CG08_land_8_20_14_0_20_45_16]
MASEISPELIFEKSQPGRIGFSLPEADIPLEDIAKLLPSELIRGELKLPELSEVDVVRHFINLSRRNFGVDSGFYPLGSCTMKYNPKVNEEIAKLEGFTNLNPNQPAAELQGILE